MFLLGLRKVRRILPGSARRGIHAGRLAGRAGSAASRTHRLATAHLISPRAWLCKEESQPHPEEGGGEVRNLGTPEPSLGRAGAQLPQRRRAPGREEAERLTPVPRLSVGCEAPLSQSTYPLPVLLRSSLWFLTTSWFPLGFSLSPLSSLSLPGLSPPLAHPIGLRLRPGFPGVASLQRLALQCNSGTHNQTVPLRPTAPFNIDHQVYCIRSAAAWRLRGDI